MATWVDLLKYNRFKLADFLKVLQRLCGWIIMQIHEWGYKIGESFSAMKSVCLYAQCTLHKFTLIFIKMIPSQITCKIKINFVYYHQIDNGFSLVQQTALTSYPWVRSNFTKWLLDSAASLSKRTCTSLYFVSPRERSWRQRVFQRRMLVIARATCAFSHAFKKGTPGMTHKGCVLQRVSLRAQWRHGLSWVETKYRQYCCLI